MLEGAFKHPAVPCYLMTHIKQKDTQLVQIQEFSELLGDTMTSMMITLDSVRQRLQHAARDLGYEMASEVILAIETLEKGWLQPDRDMTCVLQ